MSLSTKSLLSVLFLIFFMLGLEGWMPSYSIEKVLLIFLAGLVYVYFFIHTFFNPLKEQALAAKEITLGPWGTKSASMSKDELEQLSESLSFIRERIHQQYRELEGERTTFHVLLSSMIDGLIVLDEDQNIKFLNPQAERSLRIKSTEARGKTLDSVWPLREVQDLLSESLKELTILSKEITLKYNVLKLYIVPTPPVTGACAMLIFRDITEVRRLEQTRNQFLGQVSHELRTPLTIVKGYVITLLDDPRFENAHDVKKILSRIEEEADRLKDLVEQLLGLSKLRGGKSTLTFTPLSLETLVSTILEEIKEHAKRYGVEFELQVHGKPPLILGDSRQLKQVLLNLFDNAMKYSSSGQNVEVFLTPHEEGTLVRVKDHGSGIPEDDLPHVFERYFQGEKRSQGKGWGLGLPIVKEIIDAHGGTIKIESQENKGTTVTVIFPGEGLQTEMNN